MSQSDSNYIKSAKSIGILTIVSRLLGTARDVMTAHLFGAGDIQSALVIAFLIPNLARRFFGEGALSAAFLPQYAKKLEAEGREPADRFANRVICATGIIVSILTLIGIAIALGLDVSAVPGSYDKLRSRLAWILLPYMFFICVAAICSAVLNALGSYGVPAFAPVILNIFWIAGLGLAPVLAPGNDWRQAGIVACGIMAGGVVQLFSQTWMLKKFNFQFQKSWAFADAELRGVFWNMAPVILGISVIQINSVVDTVIAEAFVEGNEAVSLLYYGNRLMQFPLAVVGIAMAVAVFPRLSRQAAQGKPGELGKTLRSALASTFYVALPATVGLLILSDDLVDFLFNHGEFKNNAAAAWKCSAVLSCYCFGLWAQCQSQVMLRGFYSLNDTRTPFKVSVMLVFLNLALNLALVSLYEERGLAMSTSVCGILNFYLLSQIFRKKYAEWEDEKANKEARRVMMLSVAATIVMAAACIGTQKILAIWQFQNILCRLFFPFGAGVIAYVVVSKYILKDELRRFFKS